MFVYKRTSTRACAHTLTHPHTHPTHNTHTHTHTYTHALYTCTHTRARVHANPKPTCMPAHEICNWHSTEKWHGGTQLHALSIAMRHIAIKNSFQLTVAPALTQHSSWLGSRRHSILPVTPLQVHVLHSFTCCSISWAFRLTKPRVKESVNIGWFIRSMERSHAAPLIDGSRASVV